MNAAEWINWATNLLTVLLGSSVVVTVLQKAFNRKAEREAAERDAEKDRKDAKRQEQKDHDDESERKRVANALLAESQAIAQKTALDSAGVAFKQVQDRCDACLDELHGLRDITGRLVDAVEALMMADTQESRAQARAAIRLARMAM